LDITAVSSANISISVIIQSGPESGEFMFEFDEDKIFHVDLENKKTIWRLPDFGKFTSFEAQGALGNIAFLRKNMEIMIQRSNRTRAENVPPEVMVYPENPVELGEPKILICFVTKFSPPVLNVTWFKNGQTVEKGVEETDFYPRDQDNSFRKFSYLTFIPEPNDIYTCQVEHWGLRSGPLGWGHPIPQPPPQGRDSLCSALSLLIYSRVGVARFPLLSLKGPVTFPLCPRGFLACLPHSVKAQPGGRGRLRHTGRGANPVPTPTAPSEMEAPPPSLLMTGGGAPPPTWGAQVEPQKAGQGKAGTSKMKGEATPPLRHSARLREHAEGWGYGDKSQHREALGAGD
uniref:Major histocompatibility complex, class II, DR alpha n=1 Tax=Sphenodon punctatus TaxID=8508 RepID=A0A8D0LCD9_SPHPU